MLIVHNYKHKSRLCRVPIHNSINRFVMYFYGFFLTIRNFISYRRDTVVSIILNTIILAFYCVRLSVFAERFLSAAVAHRGGRDRVTIIWMVFFFQFLFFSTITTITIKFYHYEHSVYSDIMQTEHTIPPVVIVV